MHVSNEVLTVLVKRRLANNATAVFQKLMTELPGSCVRLTLRGVTAVDHELHELDEIGVGAIHDSDTTSSDFAVHVSKASEEDIVEHENRVLTNPVPGRIEVAGLERIEDRLNAIYV